MWGVGQIAGPAIGGQTLTLTLTLILTLTLTLALTIALTIALALTLTLTCRGGLHAMHTLLLTPTLS